MRLSILGCVAYAGLLLLPAVITLFFGSRMKISNGAAQPAWRMGVARVGVVAAWAATFLFLLASIDQLKTRGVSSPFWLTVNLTAAFLAAMGLVGGVANRGWGRILLVVWSVLLAGGLIIVVALTIP